MSVYTALLQQAFESALYRLCVVLLLILELVADDCCDIIGGSCGRCRERTDVEWLRRLSPQAAVCDGRQATHSLPGNKEHTGRPHYRSCCARTGSGRSKASSHFRQSAGCHGGRNAGFPRSSYPLLSAGPVTEFWAGIPGYMQDMRCLLSVQTGTSCDVAWQVLIVINAAVPSKNCERCKCHALHMVIRSRLCQRELEYAHL